MDDPLFLQAICLKPRPLILSFVQTGSLAPRYFEKHGGAEQSGYTLHSFGCKIMPKSLVNGNKKKLASVSS